jgi:flagellar hook-associated protein 1
MSLIGALNIGKSALATHQAAIQTTGNNIANAGNADYTRQSARTVPTKDQQIRPGIFLGTGINLEAVQRNIDEALERRIRGSIADNESAATLEQWLGRVEATFNELSDTDLSTQLSTFFNAWSNLANKPQDVGLRQIVIQSGESVASAVQGMRTQLGSLRSDVDARLAAQANDANALARQIADLNGQIVTAEGGAPGQSNALRDQRDAVLKQLSQLIDVQTQIQDSGVMNVYVGSEPLVINTQNRGVGLRTEVVDGEQVTSVIFKANNGGMNVQAGQLGALDDARAKIQGVIDQVDTLAGGLIFELNKLDAAGQGTEGFASVTASNAVDDTTVALNDDASGLAFKPVNGSFVVHVTSKATGLTTSTLVQVDLDGLNADDTTLDSLAADIDGVDNITASVVGGRLKIQADSNDVAVSFSQDTSGALAALGVNNFFTGDNARDIGVSQSIKDNPALLAAARNGERGDNQTARAIAALETTSLASLGGATLKATYESMVNGVAVDAANARNNAEATLVVKETLLAQREALSGVSLDEEAINLIRQQRAFQGASRLIAAVDEMMQQVLALV